MSAEQYFEVGRALLVVVASGIVTFLAMFAHYARRMCKAMEARG